MTIPGPPQLHPRLPAARHQVADVEGAEAGGDGAEPGGKVEGDGGAQKAKVLWGEGQAQGEDDRQSAQRSVT